ncbi:hypothetical protein HPG69_017675 [Diceros bicornis minor]|uniref:Uncharacterized protein n=1 Tax=Diceros bicornis minor TaxID=77932 RepID=A0A7J7FGP3_DICBM|nr:hypothetical protein HPG69_017675 [Diceros bicornis minor]
MWKMLQMLKKLLKNVKKHETIQKNRETPEIIPLDEDVLVTLGKEEFQKRDMILKWHFLLFSQMEKYKEKLLITWGEFLEDHFPLPDGNISMGYLVSHMIHMSKLPLYIELLLLNGIALRYPEDPTQIRLEAFHQ